MAALSFRDRERYARQLVLPGFGTEGQTRLGAASALVVGAGGLGSPLALYLAASGLGRVGIVDFDRIERSNLQRQILFRDDEIGRRKAATAAERLRALNPDITVEVHEDRLSSNNALELFAAYDIIADGSDNFATRYLTNDASVISGKPLVAATIFRFEGQLSVFNTVGGPCYRCLFPEPPSPADTPDCAEGGVLGALPGIFGSLQAMEVIKLASGIGEPLAGRLLVYDALSASFRTLRIARDPACPVCGDAPTIRALIDYDTFCGAAGDVPEISAIDLSERIHRADTPFILDVRTPEERAAASIGGLLVPLPSLEAHLGELPHDQDIVVVCRSGRRSEEAVRRLRATGFERAFNLAGGLLAWKRDVDPALQTF